MRRGQGQSGGNDSVNVQAGGSAVVHVGGITTAEARAIALDVFRANFLELRGAAEEVARDRAERITNEFLARLQESKPDALDSIREPDMLRTLYAAQEGFACSGEEDLEQELLDLLVERSGQKERDVKTLVLNEAIAAIPKLTSHQRKLIALCFVFCYMGFRWGLDLPSFYSDLHGRAAPFTDIEPIKWFECQYILSVGIAHSAPFPVPLERRIQQSATGFFTNGFTLADVPKDIRDRVGDHPTVFMPCLRDPTRLQINALTLERAEQLEHLRGIPAALLRDLFNTGLMDKDSLREADDTRADLISHIPALIPLLHSWNDSPLESLLLNTTGIVIGHACWRRLTGNKGILDNWLEYSGRVPETGNLLSCSFCGKSQKQVKKLIAGPSVYICDGCLRRVRTVLAAPGRTASTPIATIQQVGDEPGAGLCGFCGKTRYRVAAMASAGTTRICNECLDLCDEIIREELEESN